MKPDPLIVDAPRRLKLPAYARELNLLRAKGLVPSNYIAISCDWTLTKRPVWSRAAWHAVLPPDQDPATFDLAFCAAVDVILISRAKDRLDLAANAILRYQPRRLLGLHVGGDPILTFYRKAD